jgi:DNA-binding CsgD family transcriptional regulator
MMNRVAEHVARARTGLRLSHGRLHLCDPNLDDRLKAAIRKASLAPLGRSVFPGETIIARTAEGSPFPMRIVPLPPDAVSGGLCEPLAAIFVGERSTDTEPSVETIRALYGLTAAETRVLLAVLRGERISDYAERAGVSLNTVNAQLKSIFGKTGCHRQVDLVRMLMSNPMLKLVQC